MRKEEVCVYQFDELDEATQKKVLEKYRYWNVNDSHWYNWIITSVEGDSTILVKLKKLGYENVDIQFTGFYSQGDGASFTADINIEAVLRNKNVKHKRLIRELIGGGYAVLTLHRDPYARYSHENTVKVECETNGIPHMAHRILALLDKLQSLIEEERKSLCHDIYVTLEEAYEDYTSDTQVREALISNDMEFLSDGRPFQKTI